MLIYLSEIQQGLQPFEQYLCDHTGISHNMSAKRAQEPRGALKKPKK